MNIDRYSYETLENMKAEFCGILREITRKGADVELLISKLDSNGFFESPASAKYHNAFKGGLVDHSLNTYYNLKSLVTAKGLSDSISKDSIIICGLLHDISKMGTYEITAKNKKVYSPDGSKWDEIGRFDWVSEKGYSTKDSEDRFIYGNHEETSEFMIRKFIPLTVEESAAILHHHGGMSYDSTNMNVGLVYGKHSLACLLHLADMISTFIDEKSDE